ncbi:UDP-glucose 4-epimerase GalE [Patescibacteria group bacterium]
MRVLVTGGAGYIGSITNNLLIDKGIETVVFDNLSCGHKESVGDSKLVIGDLKKPKDVEKAFELGPFDAVVHFAALALAGESMEKPFKYYENNIIGGLNLLEAMRENNCKTMVFSSTCAVYGFPDDLPVTEKESYKPVSVYGSSKRCFEEIIEWYGKIYNFKYINLRYFNASGAALDGKLGEDHEDETHIIPIAIETALGKRQEFTVFGDDYETSDGTCIRDYIHVLDLADAHIKAIKYLGSGGESAAINLGVGRGYSNLEVLDMIEKVSGNKINRKIGKRRKGDPDSIYADNSKAKKLLNWTPMHSDLETIVQSAWNWHTYKSERQI